MPTVLVVDDSESDRRLIGELLFHDAATTIRYAADGVEALAKMAVEPPDIILTDLGMPRLDGMELVAAVRRQYPRVPVILITSHGSEEIAARALHQGAASYIPKQMLRDFLTETIAKVLAVSPRRRHPRLMGCMTRSESSFVLENDAGLFPPLVAYLQEEAAQMGIWKDAEQTRVGVALEEALANALYHGNLEIGAELREHDSRAYYDLITQRLCQSPYKDRRVLVEAGFAPSRAVFVISDAGRGFNPAALPDPTDPANLEKPGGRGVLLMRAFMDEVSYNARGNVVTMVKYRQT